LPGAAFDYAGASFGIIVADPETTVPEHALNEADAAMYREKKKRKEAKTTPFRVEMAQAGGVS
jgi:diguanylate cyclase